VLGTDGSAESLPAGQREFDPWPRGLRRIPRLPGELRALGLA
jgi:hypothetical protein